MFHVYVKRKSVETINVLVQAACIWSEDTRLTNSEVYTGIHLPHNPNDSYSTMNARCWKWEEF